MKTEETGELLANLLCLDKQILKNQFLRMAISSVLKDNLKFYFAFKTTSVFSYFKHGLLI